MITVFGGAVAVPSAVRSSDSTTTMRVNDVIMIRIDGAIDSTVSSAISWIARSVTPPLPWPPRLMLMSCAQAGRASRLAVNRVARNKTLRGGLAALTKDSLAGRAARPFRLRDYQTRSWPEPARAAARAARCAVHCGPRAAPVRRAVPARCRAGGEARPRAAAPFPQGSGRPTTSAEASEVRCAAVVEVQPGARREAAAVSAYLMAPAAPGAASSARRAASVRLVACGAGQAAPARDGRPSVRA